MTALNDFERLECQGIWHASPTDQRRDVIVSVGEATLILSDQQNTALVHWSLPVIERLNPGERPAIFRPGQDAEDRLELDDETMIQAIATVQKAIEKRRPHPGRLRFGARAGVGLAIAAIVFLWLPGAMISYTASVVPMSKRAAIGEALLDNVTRVAGRPCERPLADIALKQLHLRLFDDAPGRIIVYSGGVGQSAHLPGHLVLINRALLEDHEEIDVAAGYLIAEDIRFRQADPLVNLLKSSGLRASFQLLTTGELPQAALAEYAEALLTEEPEPVDEATLLARFEQAAIRSTPYAYAQDISGETSIGLIEADPITPATALPVLDDGYWISLQQICSE